MGRFRQYRILGIVCLAGITCFIWSNVIVPYDVKIVFLDVGQGDATYIETRQGYRMLIDAGPSAGSARTIARMMPLWDKTLDLLILTHEDKDHIGGASTLLEEYQVQHIIWYPSEKETAVASQLVSAIEREKREGATVREALEGQRITWSPAVDQGIAIMHPTKRIESGKLDSNDTSAVARLSYGDIDILFTGDISARTEASLLLRRLQLESEILKLAHHGSKTSSNQEFLRAVNPRVAVIQAGKENPYGHPHREVLERLKKYAITVLRTDEKGDITVTIRNSK